MKFYIVTPSYNSLQWLRGCIRSVADQVCDGIEVHHHVQDGASSDGTQAWLSTWQLEHEGTSGYTFTFEIEPDKGMYDAINKSWDKMPEDADITAHLNSDEQYLPNALKSVAYAMSLHPEVEIAVSTYIVVDADGHYICHRRPIYPRKWSSMTVCEIITCACFHRVKYFSTRKVRFDIRWRAVADLVFYRDIIKFAPRFLLLSDCVTSIFTVTGNNLAWKDESCKEWLDLCSSHPWYVYKRHGVAYRWCNLKRRLRDCFYKAPKSYSIFLNGSSMRQNINIMHPTSHWGCRIKGER